MYIYIYHVYIRNIYTYSVYVKLQKFSNMDSFPNLPYKFLTINLKFKTTYV